MRRPGLTPFFAFAALVLATGYGLAQSATLKQRQDAMGDLGDQMKIIKAFAQDSQGQAADVKAAALKIAATAEIIPSLFPQGTSIEDKVGKTAAKPIIWAEFDRFSGIAASLKAEAEKLAAVADSGDRAAIDAQLQTVGRAACGTCHQAYREKQ